MASDVLLISVQIYMGDGWAVTPGVGRQLSVHQLLEGFTFVSFDLLRSFSSHSFGLSCFTLFVLTMFLGNASHALVGLLSCLALLAQQAYTASIPSEGRLYRFGRVYQGLHHITDSTSDSSSHGDTLDSTKRSLQSEDRLFRFGRVYQGLHHISDSTSDSSSHEGALTPTKRTVESNPVDAATGTSPETANVIIPAYAYPSDGAWTPLEDLCVNPC